MLGYHEAIVTNNLLIGDQVRHLTVNLSEKLPFEDGQFFLLRIKGKDGEFVERSYSAANFSDGKQLEFAIRIEPEGKMSRLITGLKKKQIIDVKGPFGKFGFLSFSETPRHLVLIAGGVGIAPFRSMIQKSFQNNDVFPIQLFYGFRTSKDFLFQEELKRYAKTGRLSIITSTNKQGFIAERLQNIKKPEDGTNVFLCGPPLMVKSTLETLLRFGYPRSSIHLEAW